MAWIYYIKNDIKQNKLSRGFSIVELLVVITVIAILAAITIVSYIGVTKNAQSVQIKSSSDNIRTEIGVYIVSNDIPPASITDCPTPAPTNICIKLTSNDTIIYNQSVSKANGIYSAIDVSSSYGLGILGSSQFIYTSSSEITSSNEFLQYMDMAPYINKYGLVKYQISFDIKSANTSSSSTMNVYLQNGSNAKYKFGATIPVTTTYSHQTIIVTPTTGDAVDTAILAFYGNYGTGNIPTVKNMSIQLAQ